MSQMSSLESLKEKMLALDSNARLQLAHALVMSFEAMPQSQLSALWISEAERRDAEMESGDVDGIPSEKVFEQMEAKYNK